MTFIALLSEHDAATVPSGQLCGLEGAAFGVHLNQHGVTTAVYCNRNFRSVVWEAGLPDNV
jgi:hypothetical protein